MKNFPGRALLPPIIFAAILFSCIPARQVEELKDKYAKCEDERSLLNSQVQTLETENTEQKERLAGIEKQISALVSDTTVLGTSLRRMTKQYDKINKLNDELLRKQGELQAGSEAENRKLLAELQQLEKDLQNKEDELKKLELKLNEKEKNLDKLSGELELRENRVRELEAIISQKDEAVKALKDKVARALLGFTDKGLTIEQKNGKIYVSLEAKLLFAKGSTKVSSEGKKALVELAKVLAEQEDIHILVEGHTDTDKLAGTGAMKDNWDLSVLRATSVVRIITENSEVDPKRLTAAGRSEFIPLEPADNEEAKSKNRRIEVILTPNLDELFKLLEPPQD